MFLCLLKLVPVSASPSSELVRGGGTKIQCGGGGGGGGGKTNAVDGSFYGDLVVFSPRAFSNL